MTKLTLTLQIIFSKRGMQMERPQTIRKPKKQEIHSEIQEEPTPVVSSETYAKNGSQETPVSQPSPFNIIGDDITPDIPTTVRSRMPSLAKQEQFSEPLLVAKPESAVIVEN